MPLVTLGHFWGFLLLRTGMGMNICLMQLHQAQGHCTWLGSDALGASRGLANDRHLRHCSYVVMSPLEGQTTKLLVLLCECCDRTTEGAHYRSAVSSINMHKNALDVLKMFIDWKQYKHKYYKIMQTRSKSTNCRGIMWVCTYRQNKLKSHDFLSSNDCLLHNTKIIIIQSCLCWQTKTTNAYLLFLHL